MQKIKNEKGITLLILVITVIVLALITIPTVIKTADIIQFNKFSDFKDDITNLSESIEQAYGTEEISGIGPIYTGDMSSIEKNENDDSIYYAIDLDALNEKLNDVAGISINEINQGKNDEVKVDDGIYDGDDVYIINNQSRIIYYTKGVTYKETTYYSLPGAYEKIETKELIDVTKSKYIGYKVNYVASNDSSLVWRIFYADDDWVYLISSKQNGDNTVESAILEDYIGDGSDYTQGASLITDSNLKNLNKKWFEELEINGENNTSDSAQAIAWMMDQSVWSGYKDSEGRASYIIAGPTIELFKKSFNKTAEDNQTDNRMTLTCEYNGYNYTITNNENNTVNSGWLNQNYNKGVYYNGVYSYVWIASPSNQTGRVQYIAGLTATIAEAGKTVQGAGLRPVAIIPMSEFKSANYEITNE